MAHFRGTSGNDRLTGPQDEVNTFEDFGIGRDQLIGGLKIDTFILSVDEIADYVDGNDGNDRIDYSHADRGLRIDLDGGTVTAVFGTGSMISRDPIRTSLVAEIHNVEDATGSRFDDTINGTNEKNTLDGGDGNDTLYGRDGNDILLGGAGADHLYGGNDDDTLTGGIGDDYLNGGSGNDTVSYADVDRGVGVHVNLGVWMNEGLLPHEATFYSSATQSYSEVDTLVSIENAIGTQYRDMMLGSDVANVLTAGGGDDRLAGYGGDDTLDGGDGDDRLFGGDGADHLIGGNGSDWALYSAIDSSGNTTSYAGTVVISLANPSNNTWWAAGDTYDGIENISGSPFSDIITGNNNDNDNIIVDMDHHLDGFGSFYGLDGNDTFMGSAFHPDYFYGGNDVDTVDYSQLEPAFGWGLRGYVVVDLEQQSLNAGDALGDRFSFVENIVGSHYAEWGDTISGNYANNRLSGMAGDDRLTGRGGDDTLDGGGGDDTAVFTGNFADYTFRVLHLNDWSAPGGIGERFLEVHDTHADRDGTDYVIAVEHLEFHNIIVNTWDLMG